MVPYCEDCRTSTSATGCPKHSGITFHNTAPTRIVWRLRHDFNIPRNEGGFYEVVLDRYSIPPHVGDEVIVGDSEYEVRGRVRCLVAIVEELPDPALVKWEASHE